MPNNERFCVRACVLLVIIFDYVGQVVFVSSTAAAFFLHNDIAPTQQLQFTGLAS